MLRSNLALQSLFMGCNPRLIMGCCMLRDFTFRHRGQNSAMLLLGGVDCTCPHIFTVGPFGSVNKAPFTTMGGGGGGGGQAARAGHHNSWHHEPAVIMNDLGSGSNVDLCVIKQDGIEYIQTFETSN